MAEDKKYSHLVEQWIEESSQMVIPEEEARKTLEELRKKSPDEVRWEVMIPKLYPREVDIIDIVTGKVDDIAEVIEEHDIVVDGVREYHRKHGYDAAKALSKFYHLVYSKMPEHENPDPNFDFEKLVKAYEGSTEKT